MKFPQPYFAPLIVGAFFRREAGLLHADMRAALVGVNVQVTTVLQSQRTPAIRQP